VTVREDFVRKDFVPFKEALQHLLDLDENLDIPEH
jgi:hypothetical protein